MLSKKQQTLWKIMVAVASAALILTSLTPLLTSALR